MPKITIEVPDVAPHVHEALKAYAERMEQPLGEAARWALTVGAMATVSPADLVARLHVLAKQPTGRMRRGRYEPLPAWQEYVDTIGAIARHADPTVLDDLLAYFDDASEERGLMDEMLRALLRAYPPATLVPAAVRAVGGMCRRAPEATLYLHRALLELADDGLFEGYLAGVGALKAADRAALREALADVDDGPRITRVRATLQGKNRKIVRAAAPERTASGRKPGRSPHGRS
ncbi:MAG: hypothetical protein IT385_03780 [Deltaproteobacteria bacterium]|nr:hypothetical protein [Deltaproteobacteria bacterium]